MLTMPLSKRRKRCYNAQYHATKKKCVSSMSKTKQREAQHVQSSASPATLKVNLTERDGCDVCVLLQLKEDDTEFTHMFAEEANTLRIGWMSMMNMACYLSKVSQNTRNISFGLDDVLCHFILRTCAGERDVCKTTRIQEIENMLNDISHIITRDMKKPTLNGAPTRSFTSTNKRVNDERSTRENIASSRLTSTSALSTGEDQSWGKTLKTRIEKAPFQVFGNMCSGCDSACRGWQTVLDASRLKHMLRPLRDKTPQSSVIPSSLSLQSVSTEDVRHFDVRLEPKPLINLELPFWFRGVNITDTSKYSHGCRAHMYNSYVGYENRRRYLLRENMEMMSEEEATDSEQNVSRNGNDQTLQSLSLDMINTCDKIDQYEFKIKQCAYEMGNSYRQQCLFRNAFGPTCKVCVLCGRFKHVQALVKVLSSEIHHTLTTEGEVVSYNRAVQKLSDEGYGELMKVLHRLITVDEMICHISDTYRGRLSCQLNKRFLDESAACINNAHDIVCQDLFYAMLKIRWREVRQIRAKDRYLERIITNHKWVTTCPYFDLVV